MCNLYLMYYSKVDDGGFEMCDVEENQSITQMVSPDLNEALPDDTNRDQLIKASDFAKKTWKDLIKHDWVM